MKIRLLFYITQNGSNIEYIKKFIFYLLNNIDIELFIVCDSKDQFSELKFIEGLDDKDFHLSLVRKNSLSKDEYWKILFNERNINAFLFFNGQMTVTRSKDLVKIYESIKNSNIKFYWINRLFLKDRYCIYDDIYFNNSKISQDYQNILQNNSIFKDKLNIEKYINAYWKFKDDVHEQQFNSMHVNRNKSIFNLVRNFNFFKSKIKNISTKQIKLLSPYVLLLLPKKNHWFNEYANQEFLNFNKIINLTCSAAKKNNLNVIIKRHPRERGKPLSCGIDFNNVYTYEGDLSVSASKAELVVFTGTTSGLETLLLHKKVIQLGNHSALPVENSYELLHKVSNMNKYLSVFDKVLTDYNFDKLKLHALLKSIFENSYSLSTDTEDKKIHINADRNLSHIPQIAKNMSIRLKEDFFKN